MRSYKSLLNFLRLIPICVSLILFNRCSEKNSNKLNNKHNVLFIAVDDLNDYVSLLQDFPGIKTPNLKSFAKHSITFTHAYCAGPVCNPSRTSLLTGLAPHVTGIYNNGDHWTMSEAANEAISLPEAFKAAEYKTFWAGKIFHPISTPSKTKLEAMWDELGTNVPGECWDGAANVTPFGPGLPKGYGIVEPEAQYPDVANVALAKAWLNQEHDKPFFMAVGIIRPHTPLTAPKKYFDMYPIETLPNPPGYLKNDLDDIPAMGKKIADTSKMDKIKELNRWKEVLQAYLACVSFADNSIGGVINALNNSKYKDNTIVILWGDHGFHVGEKSHFAKSTIWEQGTRNLLMMSVPNSGNNGTRIAEPVSLLDIYPTLQELCNLPDVPQELSGESVLDLIRNPETRRSAPVLTTYPYMCHTIRDSRWRYIRYKDGSEELYDHQQDKYEWYNLANDLTYRTIMDSLKQWIPIENAKPVGPVPYLEKWKVTRKETDMSYKVFGNMTK